MSRENGFHLEWLDAPLHSRGVSTTGLSVAEVVNVRGEWYVAAVLNVPVDARGFDELDDAKREAERIARNAVYALASMFGHNASSETTEADRFCVADSDAVYMRRRAAQVRRMQEQSHRISNLRFSNICMAWVLFLVVACTGGFTLAPVVACATGALAVISTVRWLADRAFDKRSNEDAT